MTMNPLYFTLHAAGVLAPGLPSLAALREHIRSQTVPDWSTPMTLPSPATLPANERRRASEAVKLTQACIEQVLLTSPFPAQHLHTVFAADEGTGEVCTNMLAALATPERSVSPLVFTNSVQNAASGYFSIAWRNRRPSTVASLGLESFASGLLCAVTEAIGTRQPVMLVAYDVPMLAPLAELRPVQSATATAWIISSGLTPYARTALGSFELTLVDLTDDTSSPWPTWVPEPWKSHSSVCGFAALALLDEPLNDRYRTPIGQQLLQLQRVAGDRSCN